MENVGEKYLMGNTVRTKRVRVDAPPPTKNGTGHTNGRGETTRRNTKPRPEVRRQSRQTQRLGDRSVDVILGANPFIGMDRTQIAAAAARLVGRTLVRPGLLASETMGLAREWGRVLWGTSDSAPARGDRRFTDVTWEKNPVYKRWMQGYLAWCASVHGVVDQVELDAKSAGRARFALSLFTEAVAPTNGLVGNPAAIKQAFETGGRSLWQGAGHWLDDVIHNGGLPVQVDSTPFQVGDTVACTAGSVVFRNDVLELIQYAPTTPSIHTRPLLLIPPQINKFYVLDLAPGRSMFEYVLGHGHQMWTVSWRNPTAAQRDWDLETYVEALKEALDAICDITGSKDVNVLGACAGGITTAVLLGHLAAAGIPRVHSVTFLVTVLDTSVDSMIGMFASEKTIAMAIRRSRRRGVLSGRDLARIFSWLRPNDLVWNYWVNNYLMGNAPPAFDVLSWNADTTNLPAALHAEFLGIFQHNLLAQAGTLTVCDTPIDLSNVTCDSYVVGASTDHITPWTACYQTPSLLGGRSEFVLSSSGHIQALVNPPGNPKAKYFTNPKRGEDPQEWLANAIEHAGTWWDHWITWLDARGGKKRKAPRKLGNRRHPALGPAPGEYVHERV